MKVSVVIVNWNVKELLRQCLASVQAEATELPPDAVEILVVDNASSDGSQAMLREEFPDVRLLANAENRGFSAACNQAIAQSSGEAILLLNPDAALMPGALTSLIDHLEHHAQVAAVGPRLLNPDGSIQSSRRRFPSLTTAFLESTIIQSYFPHLSHLRRYYCQDITEDREQEVDWLTGACLLLRRRSWEEVGPFDQRFFLYFEELDWCLRAKKAGWRIAYLPHAEAVHHGGQSSAQDLLSLQIHFTASKCGFYRKHFGLLAGQLVRWSLMLNYLLLIAEDALKLALGHKVAMRRQRIAMLGAVLKWGLTA